MNHIIRKKSIASHTQRQLFLLDNQTAEHEFNYNLLLKAMKNAYMTLPDTFEMQLGSHSENTTPQLSANKYTNSGSLFKLSFD